MSLFLLLSLLSLLSLATSLGSPPCDRIIAGLEGQDAVAWEGVSGQELWEMSPCARELEDMMSLAPPATERLYQELHGGADGIPSTRSFFLEDIGEVALRILEPQQGKVYVKSEEDNDRGGIVSEEGKLIVVFELVCASKVPFSMRFNAQWQANEHFHELSVSSSCSSNEHQKYNYLAMPNAWSLLRKGQNTFGLWLELEGSEKFMEEVVDFYVFSCPQQRRGCKEHAFLKGTVGGRIGGGGGGGGRGGRGGGESASVVVNEAGEEEGETVSGSMGSRLAGVWDGRVCELISSFSGGAIEFQLTVIERYQFGCSYQVRFLLPDSSGNHQDRWRSPGRVDVQDRHHIEDNGRRSRLLRLSFRLPACLQQDRILVQLVSSSCSPPIEWWGARVWDLGGPQQELSWPWRHGWAGEAITPGRTVAKFRVEMDKFGDGAKRRGEEQEQAGVREVAAASSF
ncbi:hypothetical protein GUITHDRAFT_132495 [Guillardia theta CCMP2712]|uniref:Uncharacterized protein n=1 Tax=Guillardia theta (strain CCMP2712) TaxID=905079 RepID=L1K136_GUITC|nr:hypothetical protein GUITHDRAFT_132495 [Guillardia theta CCMP2712]EKX54093.1 hypothetical protein GUITHDRAFT_132495 [Guillardia theta CCMP2712]|eukprot:XP_005841073.1 hypothetical protein GUITHDRAFT_132495 [Guillardia theta CCMP2712]